MRRVFTVLFALLVALAPSLFPSGTPAQTGGVVVFNGIEFAPLGGASAAPDTGGGGTTPCCLTVSNIGSSGEDGVCMEPGPSQGAWAELADLPDPDTTTAVVIITGLTALGSSLNTQFASMTLTNTSGMQTAETDWSFIGSLARRVEVWNNGMPVAQFSAVVGPIGMSAMPLSVGMAVDGMIYPLPAPTLPAPASEPLRPYANAGFPAATVFSVGSPPVMATGDELRVFPENPTSYPTNLSRMEMKFQVDRTMAPATVRITDAALRQFGRMHRGAGDFVLKVDTMSTVNGELDITIPNTNGGGMVEMSIGADPLGPEPGATSHDDCLIWDIKDSDVGMVDRWVLHGTLGTASAAAAAGTTGTFDIELVSLDLVGDGTQWLATPDFTTVDPAAPNLTLKSLGGAKLLEVPAFSGSYTVAGVDLPTELGGTHNDNITLVHAYATDRAITVPGHGTFFAGRVELTSTAGAAAVGSYTRWTRELQNAPAGTHTVKVEKSKFKWATFGVGGLVPVPGVRTTDFAFATAGYDYLAFHSDDDPLVPGSRGMIVFEGDPAAHEFGVAWLPLGPTGAAGTAEIDFVEVAGGGAETAPQGVGLRLVANGSGADLFVDPGVTGTTEVEVIVRDAQGAVTAQFPWLNFSQPVLTLPDFPEAAGLHRLSRGRKSATWISLGYEANLNIGGPAASATLSPLTKAELIEVVYDVSSTPAPDPDLGILADGVPAIIFTGEEPNPVGILQAPRAYTTMNLPYPNPFNPQTTLSFELREAGDVSLRIYNIEGRYVSTVHSGALGAGPHAFTWDGRNRNGQTVASGVYFAELRAPDGVHHAKLNLLK